MAVAVWASAHWDSMTGSCHLCRFWEIVQEVMTRGVLGGGFGWEFKCRASEESLKLEAVVGF